MEINEIMYIIWIAPLFMMGTLLWLATDKTHGKDGRRKGGNDHEVQRAVNMLSRSESLMLGTSSLPFFASTISCINFSFHSSS